MIRRVWLLALLLPVMAATAHTNQEAILASVGFDQRIGAGIPAAAVFVDADGTSVPLTDLADGQPLLLVMSWFDCPNLCPMLLDGLASTTDELPFATDTYRVAVVSIAPNEGADAADALRERLRGQYGPTVANWSFLTGSPPAIDALAEATGFRYAYDADSERYAHAAGIVVISPKGRINRYLFGMRPDPGDLRLALTEAGQGALGGPVEGILLRCYRFNPQTGTYNLAVMDLLRVGGSGSFLALAGLVLWLKRREGQ